MCLIQFISHAYASLNAKDKEASIAKRLYNDSTYVMMHLTERLNSRNDHDSVCFFFSFKRKGSSKFLLLIMQAVLLCDCSIREFTYTLASSSTNLKLIFLRVTDWFTSLVNFFNVTTVRISYSRETYSKRITRLCAHYAYICNNNRARHIIYIRAIILFIRV